MSENHVHEYRRSSGYLVIRRVNWAIEYPEGVARTRIPALPLDTDEITTLYRGFDGDIWPEGYYDGLENVSGLAPESDYLKVKRYLDTNCRERLCDLVYVFTHEARDQLPVLPNELRFCGYDYGYYLSPTNLYSALFHEVIYGAYDELRVFAKSLNRSLLFDSLEDAADMGVVRTHLLTLGADLEEAEPCCTAYGIYALSRDT